MPTARDRFDRQLRWVRIPTAAALAVFIVASVAVQVVTAPWLLQFVGVPAFVAVFLIGIVSHKYLFRCPACDANLTSLVAHRLGRRVDPRIRFCPYCGLELDAKLPMADEPSDPPV